MNIVYFQCDMRRNKNLLSPFAETTVIGSVVEKFKKREEKALLVADLYDCSENEILAGRLRELGVDVRLSPISNITHRLIDYCESLDGEHYIIRVSGSQVLLNLEYLDQIIDAMEAKGCDYFYDRFNDGQVPEVVRSGLIVQHKEVVQNCSRYYEMFEKIPGLTGLTFQYPAMPVKVHAANKAMLAILERYYCRGSMALLREKICDAVYRMGSDSCLASSGYLQTLIENELFDGEKEAIPWYTYPMIGFLKEKLKKNMKVFEFGAGYSTLFYAQKVRHVISIEHDRDWYLKIKSQMPENVEIKHIALTYDGAYARSILNYCEEFDVLCIDGRDRCNCAMHCISALKKDGVIIFDDSDRDIYAEAYMFLEQAGFKRLDFKGLCPGLAYSQEGCTSVFYRGNNCFGL